MRKPILLSRTKKPTIQIGILRSILLNGQQSKTSVTNILKANYSDVSDAFQALSSSRRIKLSDLDNKDAIGKKVGRPERFYEITEAGIRFLLDSDFSIEIFWKAITLLSICSKERNTEETFEEYYKQFEYKCLGHSAVYGYLIQRKFFDDIADNWHTKFETTPNEGSRPTFHQAVIEFLAMKGQMSFKELNQQFHATKDLLTVIRDLSISTEYNDQLSPQSADIHSHEPASDSQTTTKEYLDFILHTIIITTRSVSETKYELSLFGVLLVMLIVHRYHRSNQNTNSTVSAQTNDAGERALCLYNQVHINDYFDNIAHNYGHKLPLIFGRWNLLKRELGVSFLYNTFSFLFYRTSPYNSFNQSIWRGGNKEFYDDIRSISDDTSLKLYPIFEHGLRVKEKFDRYLGDNRFRGALLLLGKKLDQIYAILKYADISTFIENLKNRDSLPLLLASNNQISLSTIRVIETIFRDELTLLFFLNLNTIKWHEDTFEHKTYQNLELVISQPGFPRYLEMMREISYLGPPKHRLASILNKDNEIKQWFTEWMESITNYRKETVHKMFYTMKEIYKPDINVTGQESHKRVPQRNFQYDTEYNLARICSDITS